MGSFFHAVRVFGEQLAAVRWQFLALALGIHFVRLVLRALGVAGDPLARPIRASGSSTGASSAPTSPGSGSTRSRPARGGRRRQALPDPAPHPGLDLHDAGADARSPRRSFDCARRRRVHHLGARQRRPADPPGLLAAAVGRLGLLRQARARGPSSACWCCSPATVIAFIVFVENGGDARARFMRGFAIVHDRPRLVRGRARSRRRSPGCCGSPRSTTSSRRSDVHAIDPQRAPRARRRLARDALPGDAGRAGTKQGLIVLLFHGEAINEVAPARLQRRDEHRARRLQPRSPGSIALFLMARTLSWKRAARGRGAGGKRPTTAALPCAGAVRVGLPARDRARRRAPVHLRGRGGRRRRARSCRAVRAAARPRDRGRARGRAAGGDRRRVPVDGGRRRRCRPRSSTSRSGSPTTTARRRRARSRSLPPSCRSDARSRHRRRTGSRCAGEASRATLLPEQRAAVERIVGAVDAGAGGAFLLYGPTGSGKTEVYLQACGAALERGLGAIILVPEISLAPQTVGRVRARFGDRVAILHSGLTTRSAATSASGSRAARRGSWSGRGRRCSRRCAGSR